MVDKISQNLKYSESAVLMCRENALSLCERETIKSTLLLCIFIFINHLPPPPPPPTH
ncbi:MAG: hypothetical protein LBR36_02095 [Bacteroidales bacterium]|nr:hypothetical protein [Bacteroidales bacterium]